MKKRCASTLMPLSFPEECVQQDQCPLGSICEKKRCCPQVITQESGDAELKSDEQVDEIALNGNTLEEHTSQSRHTTQETPQVLIFLQTETVFSLIAESTKKSIVFDFHDFLVSGKMFGVSTLHGNISVPSSVHMLTEREMLSL